MTDCPGCKEYVCHECGHCMCAPWISVKDKIPEEGNFIVYGSPTCETCGTDFRIIEARHIGNGLFEFGEYDCGIDVTHWMPLPKAPEK